MNDNSFTHAGDKYRPGDLDVSERFYEDEDEDGAADFYEDGYEGEDDGESALQSLARLAADVEAGRAEPWKGWSLDRSHPGMLVWTTPSGRRYASTLLGDSLPLPR